MSNSLCEFQMSPPMKMNFVYAVALVMVNEW